ncbi:thioester reductase domain-containing protein [Streptomyces sp. NBC_00078]|uniref:thioester reductase domain-containing protein n=1 Tax=unclassified Streptomyces TaxID=2593676 RepID=UPI0022595BA1|nr:thioester reductase domain-containing protein [Streptomyces sp. NBC_00078]MCX5423757.1 thioester reductase domain-containing protein [Streptomyces sp. NBC_00078]
MTTATNGSTAHDRSDLLRRALVELKTARAEAAEARKALTEPIAVVGVGCRFPGAGTGVEGFWDLLTGGRSAIREIPADRWDADAYFDADPDAPGRTYARHGGFVDGVREFDAGLFGIPPREAAQVDPQHRLVLEVAWEALEHAGIAPDSLRGSRTGVFVGMGGSDYERLTAAAGDVAGLDGYTATGGAQNFAANRVSYVLGLEGPSMVVDTACSSSLVALHLACQALRAGECERALVGGVNLLLSPGTTVTLSKARMLSPEGQCKTFDASADGYVRGEGCGVVVLRPLADAVRDGQEVLAVVSGSAVNQDGRSSGLTVPRGSAQQDVIRRALAVGGVAPGDVGYVEAHGTGTPLGDPIEVRALASVLGEGRAADRPVVLGSVKTNIGHLEAAAGIAGLVKAILTVGRGVIAPHLNLTTPNPLLEWDELPVRVATELTPWDEERRVAGVSSFGFGGTNAHVVVESPPAPAETIADAAHDVVGEGPVVVKVSGRNEDALRASAQQLATFVRDSAAPDALRGVAWESGVGRADLPQRAAVVAGSLTELADGLGRIAEGGLLPAGVVSGRRDETGAPRIAFLAPGGEATGVPAGLYGRIDVVTETVDEVCGAVDLPPSALIVSDAEPQDGGVPDADGALSGPGEVRDGSPAPQRGAGPQPSAAAPRGATSPHDAAAGRRPLPAPLAERLAAYATAVALGAWWKSVGVAPDVVAGHGAGAYAAAALAGVFTVADGARLVAAADDRETLAKVLADIELRLPEVDFVSDATGKPAGAEAVTVDYWLRQAAEPVPFEDVLWSTLGIRTRVLVELGSPDRRPMLAELVSEGGLTRVASAHPADTTADAHECLLRALARVWSEGADVDWAKVNGPRPARVPKLPTYPFQRRTHWMRPAAQDTAAQNAAAQPAAGDPGAALRPRVLKAATGDTIGETRLSLSVLPFLAEHRVHDRLVVPGVVYLELLLRCAAETFDGPVRIEGLELSRPLVLGDDDAATVQVVISPAESGRARARVFSADPKGGWQQHLTVVVVEDEPVSSEEPGTGPQASAVDLHAVRARCAESLDADTFYRQAWHPSFRLGPSFRLVQSASRGPGAAAGTLALPGPDAEGITAGIRPELLLLDACVQLVAVAAHSGSEGWDERPVRLGTGYQKMIVHRPVEGAALECAATVRDTADGSVIGDISLTTTDGTPVVDLLGVSFRPVGPQILSRLIAERATGEGGSGAPDAAPAPAREVLLAADPARRQRLLLDHFVRVMAGILAAEPEEVHPDTPVTDLADSLMMAELQTMVDRDLGIAIPMEMIFDGSGLRSLAAWAAEELAETAGTADTAVPANAADASAVAGAAEPAPPVAPKPRPRRRKTMTVEEMAERARLEESIAPALPPEPAGTAPEATLLTGATGFVGAFLLAELLDRRSGDVLCLVRADDEAHALRRILANLEAYGVDPEPYRDRIVPLVGDLGEPLFGLDDGTFAALHARVGSIIHCGGMVKWTYPYSGLEDANVAGTREVLRLATAGAARPVHFISTVGVFSSIDYTADLVHESDDLHSSGALAVGYAQTKWVAEQMVRTAHERGVPVTIHRINTGGHSRTGSFNRLDHLNMMLKGCIEAGIAPQDVRMPVQPAPIDYVAAAVVEVAGRPELSGRTFHLVNHGSLSWSQLFDHVEEFGYPMRRLPFDEWKERVTNRSSGTMALLGLAPFLNDTVDDVRLPLSDSAQTRSALDPAGLVCPSLDADLVHTYLRRFVATGFIDAPARPDAPQHA